jgi:uncharacterized repeat protein (TIGR01451 family)
VTVPAGSTQPFDFTLAGGPSVLNQSFQLTDGGSRPSGFVKPGSGYAAAETAVDGWDQSSATCDDDSPVTNINVSPGETVTCTFTNTQRGQIVIEKVTVPSPSTQPFDFTLSGGPSALSTSFPLADGESFRSAFVKPGTGYVAYENVPTGWLLTSATCDDDSLVSDIDLSPGEIVTCTFTNTAKPVGITLDKKVNGADHAAAGDALLVHSNDPLTYTIVITNTSEVALTITALTDSLYADLITACPQGVDSVLEPGASFTCTYRTSAVGDAHNVAAVSAIDSLQRPVSDTDETFVDVINPAISIVKTGNPISVSAPSGPVTFTYVVTNTGDTTLSDLLVIDNVIGTIGRIGTLGVGESVTFTVTVTVDGDTPLTNIGTAQGTDVLGRTVTDDDSFTLSFVAGVVFVAPAELPRTGASIQGGLYAALSLVGVGFVLLVAGRRRQRLYPPSI